MALNPSLLRNVAVFVEVGKARSFSRAALALELPKSTVSRRIAELERDAGVRLFTRSTQKVSLTEDGEQYFRACCQLVDEASTSYEQLANSRHSPRGQLRIAATTDFGLRLAEGLPAFCAEYPELQLEFDFTTRRVDPFTENCDVAIHIGVPADSNLTAHKLAEVELHLLAAPRYIETAGPITKPADLGSHLCILESKVHRIGIQHIWSLSDGRRRAEVEVNGPLTFNSIGIIRRAAVAGGGIALMPKELCTEDVQAGRLVRVLPRWRGPVIPLYALTAARVLPARTRVFLDFVARTLGKAVAAR
jgi:DNA-binding transcriptional LysR family regulator